MLNTNTTTLDMLDSVIVEHLKSKVYTALPAIVTKVSSYPNKQMVDVRITVVDKYPDGKSLNGADILDVPVIYPSGGGGLLSFPIQPNDTVLIIFLKRCMDEWIGGDGQQVVTSLNRQFNLADAVAIPGLFPSKNTLSPDPDHVVLKFAGSTVTLFNNGNVTVDSPKTVTVNAGENIVAAATGDVSITANGNMNLTAVGNVTISGATINLN